MAGRKWTIAIRPAEGSQARKITKIIGLNGGGFSVLAPYHHARSGFLCKMPVDPAVQGQYVVPTEDLMGFSADDRVKLSYHTDGFVQLSGENPGRIISGRDQLTGQPKGLGLFTHPLTKPIWSGPSVATTIWGIGGFEETEAKDKALVFEPNEWYYRGCTSTEANRWVLSFYAFPKQVTPPARLRDGVEVLNAALEPLSGPLVSIIQLKLIRFE
jgi:hypothetical protein